MKVRYFILSFLLVLLCFSIWLFTEFYERNTQLKNKLNSISEVVIKNENDRDLYFEKEKELEDLKESNKDKILKYDEVKKWNEEVKQYLD